MGNKPGGEKRKKKGKGKNDQEEIEEDVEHDNNDDNHGDSAQKKQDGNNNNNNNQNNGAPLSDREIKKKELIETRRYSIPSIDTLSIVYEYEKQVERLKEDLNRIESTIATISNEDKMFESREELLRIKNKVSLYLIFA